MFCHFEPPFTARLRRRLEAMGRVLRSYKPGVDDCQDRVAVEVRPSI
jgi:hypothetical protein